MVFLLIMPLITIAIQSHRVNATEPALLRVVNPLTGTNWLNFTSIDKKVGDTFIVNVTVANVAMMMGWQFGLQWNASLFECVNVSLPADNVLAYTDRPDGPLILLGPDLSQPGLAVAGTAAFPLPDQPSFYGSGVLAQVEFKIKQKSGQCDLSFEGINLDTFLLESNGNSISFTPVSGHYSLTDQTLFGDVDFDEKVDVRDVYAVILAVWLISISSGTCE
jgi:hypothetical protein